MHLLVMFFFFSSRRRHTRWPRDWSSDVCSSDLFNPAPAADTNIRDVLAKVFDHSDDGIWVNAIPDEEWVRFLNSLWRFEGETQREARRRGVGEVLYAIEMLSIWAAAEELEPEIERVDPKVVEI